MFKKAIPGMTDCDGKPVHEGDIVEFLDWVYASFYDYKSDSYQPFYGIVRWNTEYFTYEPLIFAEEDFNGNSFAHVCKYKPAIINSGPNKVNYPATYFKVIGNSKDIPHLLNIKLTQMVGRFDTTTVTGAYQPVVQSGTLIVIRGDVIKK